MNKLLMFSVFILLFLSFSFVFAVDEEAITFNQAQSCLSESHLIMGELEEAGFNVIRVNTTLGKAEALLESQKLLEQRKKSPDYSLVTVICDDVLSIKEDAFNARDALGGLEKFYEDSSVETSSIDLLISEIYSEIDSERYELVFPLIDETYNKILNEESQQTAINLFYRSTTQTFINIIENNWKWLSIAVGALLALLLVYRTAIMRLIYKKRLKNLNLRKDSLKDLIGNTQRDYFQYGKISEREYDIRTKNFAEMIREIDRQIPLLEEQLVKFRRSKTANKNVSSRKKNEKEIIEKMEKDYRVGLKKTKLKSKKKK